MARSAAQPYVDLEQEAPEEDVAGQVREIEILTRRLVADSLAGQYHAVFKGRGMSFDSVREYQPGDDIRAIDWNVSARTGGVFVKQYVEERELTVLIAVDLSGSQGFGTSAQTKRQLAARIAAILALSAISNNDRVGLVLFSDHMERYLPPKKGRAHVLRVIQEVLTWRPQGRGTRLDLACDYISRIARKRAVVFVLSDFASSGVVLPFQQSAGQPASQRNGGYDRALGILARRHDVVPIVTRDPAESVWPDVGLVLLEDMETGDQVWFDSGSSQARKQYAELSRKEARLRDQTFRKYGLDPLEAVIGQDFLPSLAAFFRRRAARQ